MALSVQCQIQTSRSPDRARLQCSRHMRRNSVEWEAIEGLLNLEILRFGWLIQTNPRRIENSPFSVRDDILLISYLRRLGCEGGGSIKDKTPSRRRQESWRRTRGEDGKEGKGRRGKDYTARVANKLLLSTGVDCRTRGGRCRKVVLDSRPIGLPGRTAFVGWPARMHARSTAPSPKRGITTSNGTIQNSPELALALCSSHTPLMCSCFFKLLYSIDRIDLSTAEV